MKTHPLTMAHTKCLCQQCGTQITATGWPLAATACNAAGVAVDPLSQCQEAKCPTTKAAADRTGAFTKPKGVPLDTGRWTSDSSYGP